jgi:sulfur-oxidizing protein SoxY
MHATRAIASDADTTRRETLRILALLGIVGVARPARAASAQGWPGDAFHQKSMPAAVKTLYGRPFEASDKVTLDVPEIAENGAVVPVSVSTALPNVTTISILVTENPYTLAASYTLPDGTLPAIGCRLKMAKTTDVVAIVESAGKLFAATKNVKVTLGGCGG